MQLRGSKISAAASVYRENDFISLSTVKPIYLIIATRFLIFTSLSPSITPSVLLYRVKPFYSNHSHRICWYPPDFRDCWSSYCLLVRKSFISF